MSKSTHLKEIGEGVKSDLKEIREILKSSLGNVRPTYRLLITSMETFLYTSNIDTNCNSVKLDILEGTDLSKLRNDIYEYVEETILPRYDMDFIKVPGFLYITHGDGIVGFMDISKVSSATSMSITFTLPRSIIDDVSNSVKDKFNKNLLSVGRVSLRNSKLEAVYSTIEVSDGAPVDIMFPSIDLSPSEMWKEFSESKSNVMLLIGKPGLGKSSYIREMIRSAGKERKSHVVDTHEIALNPLLSEYIRMKESGSIFIIEDADAIVKCRSEGNIAMQPLLNVASGVIPTDTKIIISTNLPSTKDVDDALLRPGRMFKVLEFDLMSVEHAQLIRSEMDLPAVDFGGKNEVTLAEAINWHELNGNIIEKPAFGFN